MVTQQALSPIDLILRNHRIDASLPIRIRPKSASEVRRRVSVTAFMNITDDETFGSDEHGSAQLTQSAVVTDQLSQPVMHLEKGVGGEVRVELDLAAQALNNGDILIQGNAKLYEGTSENTQDLDGERNFQVLIPKDQFSSTQVNIRNDDEGGDHAEIFMNFSNSAV